MGRSFPEMGFKKSLLSIFNTCGLKNKNSLKFIDISFNFLPEHNIPEKVIESHKYAYGYINFIKNYLQAIVIEHINYKGEKIINGVPYAFFKGNNNFWHIPLKTMRYVKKQKPDIILIQGLSFPIQTIFLRLIVGKKTAIIAQYHTDTPFKRKRIFNKLADKCINAYFFTSLENAKDWLGKKIIKDTSKCHEVFEVSTHQTKKDKEHSKTKLGLTNNYNFLWVGRLNENKDPLTVLKGFEKYLHINPDARFYIIYQTEDLLPDMKKLIDESDVLRNAVFLIGKIANEDLSYWYSAADFYLSGSYEESTGLAVLEAVACDCIPVVTDIPAFRKITIDGQLGILFEPGDVDSLFEALKKCETISRQELSTAIANHFEKSLSFKAMADKIFSICQTLVTK